jgi:hypothetical protein
MFHSIWLVETQNCRANVAMTHNVEHHIHDQPNKAFKSKKWLKAAKILKVVQVARQNL